MIPRLAGGAPQPVRSPRARSASRKPHQDLRHDLGGEPRQPRDTGPGGAPGVSRRSERRPRPGRRASGRAARHAWSCSWSSSGALDVVADVKRAPAGLSAGPIDCGSRATGSRCRDRPPRRDLPLDDVREACRVARRRRTAAAGGSGPPVRLGVAGHITAVLPGQGSNVVRVQGHCLVPSAGTSWRQARKPNLSARLQRPTPPLLPRPGPGSPCCSWPPGRYTGGALVSQC
jgi:hypothetical protein